LQDHSSAQDVSRLDAEAHAGRTSNAAFNHVCMVQGRQMMTALRHLAKLLEGSQELSEKKKYIIS
jgi:hypothetical protein